VRVTESISSAAGFKFMCVICAAQVRTYMLMYDIFCVF
jgi:hypothetical protein